MDPVSAGLSIVGLGMQLFGSMQQADTSHREAQVSMGIAGDEQQINAQKQQQMQLQASRMNMENMRKAQQLRARAVSSATAQGAEFGSGLQGGLAGVTGQEDVNALGVNQNLEIGQNIFGINNDISNKRMQLAQLGSESASNQAWSTLGGALVQNSRMVGGLVKDTGAAFGNMNFLFGGNSPSGYGR